MSKSVDLAHIIQARAGDAPVRLGIILGSGLGHLTGAVEGVSIPYSDLPGFPVGNVSGHDKQLVIGNLEGQRVAIFGGRSHYYEQGDANVMRLPLAVLQALGADTVIATNAAGSLRADVPTGDIMLITDHINFSGLNPLIGEESDARFVPMTDAYDPALRRALLNAAASADVAMAQGVYAWFSGPSFETPAEIRAIRALGADAVGMSTVPEVILARFLGLKVAAISTITNMGAGLSDESLSHAQTKAMAPIGAAKLEMVLRSYLRSLS
ncbi:purine nucleoside phosphorylase [Ketogulonicigenium robustum]|uniref:Purine nucleoside phosphorylase n=1 Tax=Ketogulonicigenium robustum TaxID=92947 RepID=A0A1W6NXN1_9RHOB|nr:purine-nucleoside phosphorylase [Ketogulonicigenium robustum]ARO13998.1 purine nucleoside phosphorylase [Ketogulonicigenium robustum]